MNCPAILTGDRFLSRIIGTIDCQAAYLGSYGWQALGQPGSIAATVMTGLLTLFVALFGIRLLFGPPPGFRDVVGDVLKIGIVLTLAFSWPAFRTLIHDVVLDGPGELVANAGAPLMDDNRTLMQRLQAADDTLQRLTELGTGRQTGAYLEAGAPGARFDAQGLEDENTFGMARLFFLAGVIGSYGLLRLIAGLLLALTPLAAGMLLFEATRGLFAGWLRALVLALVATAAVGVVVAAETAILLPLLADALRLRGLGYATPSAPIELLTVALAFALIEFGAIWFMGKVAFNRGWLTLPAAYRSESPVVAGGATQRSIATPAMDRSRSQRTVESIERELRREEGYSERRVPGSFGPRGPAAAQGASGGTSAAPVGAGPGERLGSSYRRTTHRQSTMGTRRDGRGEGGTA